ncbi:MAG TPA: hypothetical protein VLA46_03535 [Saprospiraceae bacterium]|nr:hypothetical protein [Saprospiraceae bacterium]
MAQPGLFVGLRLPISGSASAANQSGRNIEYRISKAERGSRSRSRSIVRRRSCLAFKTENPNREEERISNIEYRKRNEEVEVEVEV